MQALGYKPRFGYTMRGLVYYISPGPILIKVVQLYRQQNGEEGAIDEDTYLVQVESPCIASRDALTTWTSRLTEIKAILRPCCELNAANAVDLR